MRILKRDIEILESRINEIVNGSLDPSVHGYFTLDWYNGGVALNTCPEGIGGPETVVIHRTTKRELYNCMHACIKGYTYKGGNNHA